MTAVQRVQETNMSEVAAGCADPHSPACVFGNSSRSTSRSSSRSSSQPLDVAVWLKQRTSTRALKDGTLV